MDPWPTFVGAVLGRHGVADVDLARAHGIPPTRFYRRTARENWGAPTARVRVHPAAVPCVQRDLLAVTGSSKRIVAASGEAAAWLHGLRHHPPTWPSVLAVHATEPVHHPRVTGRRARWLRSTDVVLRDGVPTLDVPALLLAASAWSPQQVWAWFIDAVHRSMTTPAAVHERLEGVGPVTGRAGLLAYADALAVSRIESRFQDDVAGELERLGYRPLRSTLRIATADHIGLEVDVPLPAWHVAVEPDGDAFHRTREQRRSDRRRVAAFAGTDWVHVPIDWRDWLLDRDHVLAAVDAAIARQQRRGIGADVPIPVRP